MHQALFKGFLRISELTSLWQHVAMIIIPSTGEETKAQRGRM